MLVTVNTIVDDDVPIDYIIPNTALVTGTSLPDTGTPYDRPGTPTDNFTGSETFSVPGSTPGGGIGERTGTGVSPNLYRATSSIDLVLDSPGPSKSIVSTSETHTAEGTPRDLAIGEVIRYRLTVDLPEGIITNLSLVDTLPAGFTYLGDARVSFVATDLDLEANLVLAHDNNIPPIFPMPAGRITVLGQEVTFDLGIIENNDINDGNQELAVIDFDVLVNNDANNNNTDLDNNDFDVLLDGTIVATSNTVGTRIVEPVLSLNKTSTVITPISGTATLGATIEYTLALSNPSPSSLAAAFDMVLTDSIPTGMTYVLGSITAPAGWNANDAAAPILTWTSNPGIGLALNSTASFTYRATIDSPGMPNEPSPGDLLQNGVYLTWTSLTGPSVEERDGTDGPGGILNDYAAESQDDIYVENIDMRIEKDDGGVTFDAGDTLVYDLDIFNDGSINATGVVITEIVPLNTTFDLAGSSGVWSCADNSPAGTTCTQSLGTVVPSVGVPTIVQFAVTIDNPLAAAVTTITNNVSIADDGSNGPEPTPGNNSDSVVTPSIGANPDLTITKDDGIEIGAPGTSMVYTLVYENVGTQDATGVVITETVSTGVTFDLGNSTPGWVVQGTGVPAVDGEAAGTVLEFDVGNVNGGDAPVTVNFAVVIDNPLAPGITEITNTATIADDGNNGADLTPGNNTDDDVDGIAVHDKDLVSQLHGVTTLPDVAIGEILTYEVTLTVPPGSMTNTHLVDTLDLGLAFVSCESITAGSLTTSIPGGFASICAAPGVNDLPGGSPDNDGRQVDFNFDTLTNPNATGGATIDLVIRYQVVVLDSLGNQSGSTPLLVNDAEWVWDSGRLDDQADGVNILEPDLSITKVVDVPLIIPGQVRNYTITISHTANSQTSAYDVILTDTLPPELEIAGPIVITGPGTGSAVTIAGQDITITWDELPDTGTSEVVEIPVQLAPGVVRIQKKPEYHERSGIVLDKFTG